MKWLLALVLAGLVQKRVISTEKLQPIGEKPADMTERSRERDDERRSETGPMETGPMETVFGAAFGPFGATVRSVFDANRVGFSLAFGPGVSRPDDDEEADGLDGATTIEIEDTGDEGENEAENASGADPESASGSESDAGDASE